MNRRRSLNVTICIILSFLMAVDFAAFNPTPVRALDKKSVAVGLGVGAVAGAGIVMAAPAIGSAVAAAGGIAGIGTAIVGGIAAAGGAVLGVLGAIGGAIAAGVGAVAGWVAGIIASPLFIPALIVIAAVAIGYYLYRRHKKNKEAQANQPVIPNADEIVVTPGDYDMNPVIPPMNQPISDNDTITIPGTPVTVGQTPATNQTPTEPVVVSTPAEPTTTTTTVTPENLAQAEKEFQAAYQEYITLITTGKQGSIQEALKKYRDAYNNYLNLKRQAGIK